MGTPALLLSLSDRVEWELCPRLLERLQSVVEPRGVWPSMKSSSTFASNSLALSSLVIFFLHRGAWDAASPLALRCTESDLGSESCFLTSAIVCSSEHRAGPLEFETA
mmetsp:Transcript_98946/g.308331  ORF Transcript_98946/g.308331 Transcript_98946/m.308331 type:complete len:108 (-) Transcript_98946:32-355(-)